MAKPYSFNYGKYESLRDKCNEMAVDIAELSEKVKALEAELEGWKEVANLQRIRIRILESEKEEKEHEV